MVRRVLGVFLPLWLALPTPGLAQHRDSLFASIRARAAKTEHPGSIFLDAARTLLAQGRFEGIEPYYHGLLYGDSVSLAAYRLDLEPIWSGEEADSFALLRAGEDRVTFVHAFWAGRETPLSISGERLMEHYRRLAYARLHFGLNDTVRTYQWWEKIRTGNRGFDDRGLMYVRHGPPHRVYPSRIRWEALYRPGTPEGTARLFTETGEVQRPPLVGLDGPTASDPLGRYLPPFEAWSYEGDSPFRLFFRACAVLASPARFQRTHCPPGADFRLVESAVNLLSPVPLLPNGDLRPGQLARMNANLAHGLGLDRLLAAPGSVGEASAATFLTRREQQEWLDRGTGTDTYGFRFVKMVPGLVTVHALSGVDGAVVTHVGFAEEAGNLAHRRSLSGAFLYSATIRILLEGRDGTVVGRRIVNRTFSFPRRLPSKAYLMGLESIVVTGPVERAQVVIQQDVEQGMQGLVTGITSPPIPTDSMEVSTLVVGSPTTGLGWAGAGDTVWFNPSATFDRSDPIQLTWEVYGIPAGESYATDIQVVKQKSGLSRLIGGEDVQIRLGFSNRSTGSPHRLVRTLSFDRLEEGRYTIRLEIVSRSGRRILREATLELIGR